MRKWFSRSENFITIIILSLIFLSGCRVLSALPRLRAVDSGLNLSLPLNKCWEYKFNEEDVSYKQIASDNVNILAFVFEGGKLRLFDTSIAEPLWSSDLGLDISSNIVIAEKSIYFVAAVRNAAASGNYILKNINKATGLVNWQTEFRFLSDVPAEMINLSIDGGKLIITEQNGGIHLFDKTDGREVRSLQVGTQMPAANAVLYNSDGYIIVETNNRLLSIISKDGTGFSEIRTGGKVSTKTSTKISAVALPADNRLVYGDRTGNVFALNLPDGSPVWKFRGGARITDITKTVYGMLVTSDDNFIYLITVDKGKTRWKRRLPGRVSGKPFVSGKYAIVASIAQPEADIINLESGKIINRLYIEADEFLDGYIFVQNNLLILSTPKRLLAFSSGNCRKPVRSEN